MKTKMTVHNLTEAKALIKESYSSGAELEFHKTEWYSHDGKYIGKSFINDTEFEIVEEDTQTSVFVEVI